MSVVVPSRAIQMVANSKDPKRAILDIVGDLKDDPELFGDQVLLGIYFRPEKTAGGIIRPEANVEEDTFQGKVGLVLKWGPDAFVDESGELYEQHVNVGEWVVFKVGDAWSLSVHNYPCRIIRSSGVRMRLKDPNIVF